MGDDIEALFEQHGVRMPDDFQVMEKISGGSLFSMLPFIRRGWKYRLEAVGRLSGLFGNKDPQTIKLGLGTRYPFELKEEHQPAWVLNLMVIFSNPQGTMRFRLDEWDFDISPAALDTMQGTLPVLSNNWVLKKAAWAHASPYGPMYGIMLDPVEPLPLAHDISIEFVNPNTTGMEIEVLVGMAGRIYIPKDEYEDFLDDMRLFWLEQMTGKKLRSW